MPVSEFIFPETIENPKDTEALEETAESRLRGFAQAANCYWRTHAVCVPNEAHHNDAYVWSYEAELVIYVTGLTPALVAAINVGRQLFDNVVLMHYDRDTGDYFSQRVI